MIVAADASVVDQDTQAFLSGLNLFDQTCNFGLLRDVCCNPDDLALDAFVVGLGDGVELFLGTTDDVYFGSITAEVSASEGWQCGVEQDPYTAKAWAAISPMPEPPPVIKATLSLTLKRLWTHYQY